MIYEYEKYLPLCSEKSKKKQKGPGIGAFYKLMHLRMICLMNRLIDLAMHPLPPGWAQIDRCGCNPISATPLH